MRETMRNSARMHSSNDQSRAAAHLRERELQAQSAIWSGSRPRSRRPSRHVAAPASRSSARQNILDAVAGEQTIDRGAARRDRPLAGRLRKGREHRVDRDGAAQRVEQIGEARRRHVMGRDAGRDRVARP